MSGEAAPEPLIRTERLAMRQVRQDDAEFMLGLLNDPDWIRHIGDRGVRDVATAGEYIELHFQRSYREHGYGLYLVSLADNDEAIGICGLVRRPSLPDADLGYALMPQYRGRGLAREAAAAVLQYAPELGLNRLLAITTPANAASRALLGSLGFSLTGSQQRADDGQVLEIYACEL